MIDKQVHYQLVYVYCNMKNLIECKMGLWNWKKRVTYFSENKEHT